jgi:hypothetical protein
VSEQVDTAKFWTPRGCGGTGLRAGPRHPWAQALGGSNPSSRTRRRSLTCTTGVLSRKFSRFALKDWEPGGSPGARSIRFRLCATGWPGSCRSTPETATLGQCRSARHVGAISIALRTFLRRTCISRSISRRWLGGDASSRRLPPSHCSRQQVSRDHRGGGLGDGRDSSGNRGRQEADQPKLRRGVVVTGSVRGTPSTRSPRTSRTSSARPATESVSIGHGLAQADVARLDTFIGPKR